MVGESSSTGFGEIADEGSRRQEVFGGKDEGLIEIEEGYRRCIRDRKVDTNVVTIESKLEIPLALSSIVLAIRDQGLQ